MAIIAGLPRPANHAAHVAIEEHHPRWRVVSEPFPDTWDKTYRFDEPILKTLRAVCNFASEQAVFPVPRPGRLVLFYVGAPEWEKLLDGFGYSVLPVPLEVENWHWPKGKPWRVNSEITHAILRRAVASTESGELHDLRVRLERSETDDALLLPPRNFYLSDGNLTRRFDRLARNGELQAERFDDLQRDFLTIQNFRNFFKRVPANAAWFLRDERGLIFATSPRGQHGPIREMDLEGVHTLADYRFLLEGLYRFGTPLRAAFQHDVQWQDGDLVQEQFYCARRREFVPISGDHADVFANDAVR